MRAPSQPALDDVTAPTSPPLHGLEPIDSAWHRWLGNFYERVGPIEPAEKAMFSTEARFSSEIGLSNSTAAALKTVMVRRSSDLMRTRRRCLSPHTHNPPNTCSGSRTHTAPLRRQTRCSPPAPNLEPQHHSCLAVLLPEGGSRRVHRSSPLRTRGLRPDLEPHTQSPLSRRSGRQTHSSRLHPQQRCSLLALPLGFRCGWRLPVRGKWGSTTR